VKIPGQFQTEINTPLERFVIALYQCRIDIFMSTGLITSSQIRAGRHLANLSQEDIAKATKLSLPTIRRAESEREVSVSKDAIAAIVAAIEAAGVEFIPENGGGAGVRLRK
jgi:DNA-binding XRE family transcriptional regulator